MDWEECQDKFIRQVEKDPDKIKSIIDMAMKRFLFIKKQEVDNTNISFLVEGYYEVIKELLVAILLKHGLKSSNHQCLIAYFCKNFPDYEFEAHLISQMSYLRNRLNYYGEKIDYGFYNKNKNEFNRIIKLLKELVQDK